MESLGKLDGIAPVMPLALSVTSVGQARYMVNSLRMLASYHESVRPLKSLTVDGTVVARNVDNVNIIAGPVDYLSWNSVFDNFISKDRFKDQNNELHIAGEMTDMTRQRLQERGWVIHENSKLFTLKR